MSFYTRSEIVDSELCHHLYKREEEVTESHALRP